MRKRKCSASPQIMTENVVRFRDSTKPSHHQLSIWSSRGIAAGENRVYLEFCYQGKFLCTSKEALLRFYDKINAAQNPTTINEQR